MSNQTLGFILSLLTAILWGILPVFLTICLSVMDSVTITFYRFSFAAVFVFVVLTSIRGLPDLRKSTITTHALVIVVTLALVVNYLGNVESLKYVAPETVQVLMQLAPLMLMFGGIVFFKERLTRLELLGAGVLIGGLLLFFNRRLEILFSELNEFSYGVLLVIGAAFAWAVYALTQKRLFRYFTAKQLTLLIYFLGALLLIPFISPINILALKNLELAALAFCCLNTVFAYGAFTEAMKIWQASKVSAVISTSPVFTFLSMQIAVEIWPEYIAPSELNNLAVTGALVVVTGSALTALGRGYAAKPIKSSH